MSFSAHSGILGHDPYSVGAKSEEQHQSWLVLQVYSEALETAGLETLQNKRETMCRVSFLGYDEVYRSRLVKSSMHHLLLPPGEFLYNLMGVG